MKNYKEILCEKGLKYTKHRDAILKILDQSEKPLTAEEMFLILKENNQETCLSTVYRTAEMFEEKELIVKINSFDDGKARYEMVSGEHKHHLICMDCHKRIAIDECPFEILQKSIKENMDFEIIGHKFEIYGYCKECRKH